MALALTHVVHVSDRRRVTRLHYAGLVVGAAATATALVALSVVALGIRAIGGVVESGILLAAAALFVGWALRVVSGHGPRFPKPRWQVPDGWRHTLPSGFTMGAYGVLLGLGFTTNPILPAIWLLVAVSLWSSASGWVVGAWLSYGAVRVVTTHLATRRALRHQAAVGTTDPDFGVDLNSQAVLNAVKAGNAVALLVAAGLSLNTAIDL